MKELLVIIPEYGQRQHTVKCVTSIRKSKIDPPIKVNIVVSDDCYPEHSYESRMLGYDLQALDCVVSRNPFNCGYARNVNRAVSFYGKPEDILLITNNDIEFTPDAVQKLIEASFALGPTFIGPLITVPQSYCLKDSGQGDHVQLCREDWVEAVSKPFNVPRPVTALSGACFLCNNVSAWFYLGGYDCKNFPAFYEDDDLFIRANLLGWRVLINYQAVVSHICNATYGTKPERRAAIFDNSRAKFKRKWSDLEHSTTGFYVGVPPTVPLLDCIIPMVHYISKIQYTGPGASRNDL
jgi:GT2 family glycosyltransferase